MRRNTTLRPSSIAILNSQRGERLVVLRHAHELLARVARIDAGHRRHVGRRTAGIRSPRRAADGCLCCAARCREHRHHLDRDRRFANGGLSSTSVICAPSRYFSAIASSRSAIALDHLIACVGGGCGDVGRNVGDLGHGGVTSAGEHQRFHAHEIDDAAKFSSDRSRAGSGTAFAPSRSRMSATTAGNDAPHAIEAVMNARRGTLNLSA